MKYKISIIIPVYNGEKFIKNCFESIYNQTIGFENLEIIFVDDNSKDNSKEILNGLSREYENCKVINLIENSGSPGKPLNAGIDNASGDFLMFIDQDDIYKEKICEVLYYTIINENVGIMMCNHEINNDGIILNQINEENLNKTYIVINEYLNIFSNQMRWDKIFNRHFIDKFKIRNPEDSLCEDVIFCTKAFLNTEKIVYLKNFYGYTYNVRDSSENASTINNVSTKQFLNVLKGYHNLAELLKENNRKDILKATVPNDLKIILTLFVKLNETKENKIKLIDRIYDLEKYWAVSLENLDFWVKELNKETNKKFVSNLKPVGF